MPNPQTTCQTVLRSRRALHKYRSVIDLRGRRRSFEIARSAGHIAKASFLLEKIFAERRAIATFEMRSDSLRICHKWLNSKPNPLLPKQMAVAAFRLHKFEEFRLVLERSKSMRDRQVIIKIDAYGSPDREFEFASKFAQLIGFAPLSCEVVSFQNNTSPCILFPGGAGEQTFTTGGFPVTAFDGAPARRFDSSHVQALRRAARRWGVSFGEHPASLLDPESDTEKVILVSSALRDARILKLGLTHSSFLKSGNARVVYCPTPPVAFQRIILDASDPNLSDLLPWGCDWSEQLGIPLFLVSAERIGGRRVRRVPWLKQLLTWSGLVPEKKSGRCHLAWLCNALKPSDLLLGAIRGDDFSAPFSFGSRLQETLAKSPCAVGVLPMESGSPLASARIVDDNLGLSANESRATFTSLRGIACGRRSSAPRF